MKKLLFLILSISFASLSFAQLSDLHYLPPLKQKDDNIGFQEQAIYLSTPETTPFTVNIYQGTNTTPISSISLSNASPYVYNLANGDNNITFVDDAKTGEVLTSSGLRFESANGKRFYVNHRGSQASQGSSLTSKGRAALGKRFRWGGGPVINGSQNINATMGIMASEDNTTIQLSGYDPSIVFRKGSVYNGITDDSYSITLDKGESFVFEYPIYESLIYSPTKVYDEWLGASIVSDKDIVVSIGNAMYAPIAGGGRDIAIDQIIPENVLGSDYVFVRGYGADNLEFAIIIATQNSTEIYVNDALNPLATIDAGEYYLVPGSFYSGTGTTRKGENMYVRASKQVYAYQSTAGANSVANVDYNFIAPVNFLLDSEVDFIPDIQKVATRTINGGISIISASSTPDSEVQVFVNGTQQNLSGTRKTVSGNSQWVTYFIDGLSGNVRVISSNSIAVGYMGQSGVIGVSGYFSGFETIPSIDVAVLVVGDCLQNGNITLTAPQGYAIYQWYLEGNPVSGATQSTFQPTLPGTYTVGITQSVDGREYVSAPVDVSDCLPEVKLDVTSNVQSLSVGESTTLRVNYKYQSFFSATNAKVNLTIPSNFQVAGNSPSAGTWDTSTNEWTIGGVSPGNEEVIELTLTALSIGNPVVVSALNSQTVLGTDNTTVLSEGGAISDDLTELFIIKNATVINAVTPLSKTILDADFSLGATSPNSNPITYSSSNEGVVKVDANDQVEIISVGTATITLNQLASETYGPGTKDVVVTVSKVSPTLTAFSAINKTYGDPNFQITAPNSTGDGTFSYTSSNTSVATVNSSTGEITIAGAGSATITATQAATSNYNTQSIQATLTVSPADQIISVGSLPDGKTILELVGPGGDNSPLTVSGTSTSGNPVTITATFDSSTSQTGTFSSNILSSVSGAGILVFDFTVSASANYNAVSTSVSLDVSKRPQNINSSLMPLSVVYHENLKVPLVASSPSTSAMVYAVVSGPATILSGELVISGTGVVKYTINNSGDNTYATASEVTKELEITQGTTTLSSFSISDKRYGDASFSIPIPTSTRTGTFVYFSNNPAVASIVGGNIQVNTPGTVTITATQPSTSNWTTGTITTTFDVLKATPVFSGSTTLSKLTIDSDFSYPLTSSVPSNPIEYRSSDLSVATVNSSTGVISIEGIGTASITATQAATTNYNAANATLTLIVAKANPTIGVLSAQTKSINDSNFILPAPSSNSSGTFSFSSSDSGVVTINSVTGEVFIVGLGASTITINQAATASYNAGSTLLTITVRSLNSAPTAVALSAGTVAENAVSGTTIGTLSATDVDAGDTFTYTLVSGTGSTDNSSFSIDGTSLKTSAVFDFETKTSYNVRVRVADAGGLTFERELTITVTNVNEDRDGDGIKDDEELAKGTDPLDACSFQLNSQNATPSDAWKVADCDGDGLTNQQEKDLGTDPFRVDTDVDGVKDKKEIEDKTDPKNPCWLVVEHQTETLGIQNWDSLDCDGDGVSNENEIKSTLKNRASGISFVSQDTDEDGIPDYLDIDDDGDGILTKKELPDRDENGVPDDAVDTDEDGIPDYLDIDDDGDGILTKKELPDRDEDGVPDDAVDTDGEGIPDYLDIDDDGDGILTKKELPDQDGDGVPDDAVDTDGDGIPDFRDLDNDGDLVPDVVEIQDGTNPTNSQDYKDVDEDDVPDYVENLQGTDVNDPWKFLDSDGDGVPEYVEMVEQTKDSDASEFKDSDMDGVPDYVQIRSVQLSEIEELVLVWGEKNYSSQFPTEVEGVTFSGRKITLNVVWDKVESVNIFKRGTYMLTGKLVLPKGYYNPYKVNGILRVIVLPKPAPRDVTIDNSTFEGSTSVFFIGVGSFAVNDPVDNIHVVSLIGDGYDNSYFYIQDNILYWNSAERAPGKVSFSIVVRVTDRDGNTIEKFFEITRTRPSLNEVIIYNTFTPNGDRFNDTWGVPEIRFYEGARIGVYDNVGTRLFYTENPDIRWDGSYKGKDMPVASYYWVIEIIETGEMRRGIVNLLRK